MGVVYEVVDDSLGCCVVIKILLKVVFEKVLRFCCEVCVMVMIIYFNLVFIFVVEVF